MQQTNVLEYLERTVQRVPDKAAYLGAEGGLTFAQVAAAAWAVGSALHRRGVCREPVAVLMHKSPEAVAAYFGCVYGGDYYVPLDAEMPLLRIERILATLEPRVMLVDERSEEIARRLNFGGALLRYSEAAAEPVDRAALMEIRDRQLDTDPLYVVFTSGSTGDPKGVVACHRSVIDYIENFTAALELDGETRFGSQTPFYVDACLKELYSTVKCGASTVIIPKKLFMLPVKLVEFLNEQRVNTLCWVVSALTMISALNAFDKVKPQYLRTVAFGSEVFPVKQFQLWRAAVPDAAFFNLYGPTECTGMSCCYRVDRDFGPDEVIPVGRPFHNTEILLLDEQDRLAAPGESGEICIRGTALTMGYYRNFEKTNACFVQNPLNDRYPELIYRTGDMGRWNERGELLFLARRDNQIKHMGHRIELGEIEANANLLDGVEAACCVYDPERGKIVLYYAGQPEPKELSAALRERLPRYMLPNRTERLERLPLTANGKIDRALLKEKCLNQS